MKKLQAYLFFILIVSFSSQAVLAFDKPWDHFGHSTAKNNEPEEPGPPDDPLSCGGPAQRSPVYVATGHFIWRESDISLTDRPSVSVNRTYNSHDPRDGVFGNGWSSNCEPLLNKVTDLDNKISYIYIASNGKRYTYTQATDGSFQSPKGHFNTLQITATDATLTAQTGSFLRFNLVGKITQWSDPNGSTRTYEYDANGQLVKMTGGGSSVTLTYNSNGHVSNIQDHTGRNWAYDYDANGNLINVTDPLGGVRTFTYQVYTDSADGHTYYQLVQVDDASGKTVVSVSYNDNRVSSYTDKGNTYSYTYDPANKKVRKRDSTGRNYNFVYNDDQIVVQDTDPLGNITKYQYDQDGNVTQFTDQLGKKWKSTFDSEGRKLTAVTPLGHTQKWEYSGTNPKPTKIITPLGNSTSITYDTKLNPTSVTDAKGNKVALTYDAKGNITSIKDAKGKTSTITYNSSSLPTTVTDAKGNATTFTYDSLGRKISSTDAEGRTTTFEYDDLGRLVKTTNALSHITHYAYDNYGRLLTLADPIGNVTQFTYDTFGRIAKKKRPDGKETSYTYDRANLITRINRYDGKTITLNYDAAMRLTSASVEGDTISYGYDERGDRTSVSNSTANLAYTYNDDGEVVSENQAGVTLNRSYNDDGALTQLTFLGQTLDYIRDKLNGLTDLKNGSDTFNFTYDVNNVLTNIGLPNGLNETYIYDDIYNLTKINTGSSILDYAHDKTGVITTKTRDGLSTAYTYDAIARLIQAGADSYNYDVAGNELSNAAKYEATTNRLTENVDYTFTYDAAGNLAQKKRKDGTETKNYSFNGRNQLVKVETLDQSSVVTKTLVFAYDPLGRRYSKTVNSTLNRYVYNGSNISAVLDRTGNTISTIVQLERIDMPLSISISGNAYYYHRNHQGSIIALTDITGSVVENYAYETYGKTTMIGNTNTGNSYAYTGRMLDDDDLYYYRARYYDPDLRTFISEDPIGFNAGDYNFYRYVGNSPVTKTDPSGLVVKRCYRYLGGSNKGDTGIYNPARHDYLVVNDSTYSFQAGNDFSGLLSPLNSVWSQSSVNLNDEDSSRKSCSVIWDDNDHDKYVEDVIKSKGGPQYGIGWQATDCQEYADEVLEEASDLYDQDHPKGFWGTIGSFTRDIFWYGN